MFERELEKLKYTVIDMHISAFLLCAVCWPVVFWAQDNILNLGLPLFIVVFIASVYTFMRQTVFLFRHPNYQQSKIRLIVETVLYSCCICFALIIGIVTLLCNFKSWGLAVFLILKIYYLLFVTATMVTMMSSAHRLNLIWVKEREGEEYKIKNDETEEKSVNRIAFLGTLMAGISGIAVQFVGIGNILYYFLCLPFLIVALILFVIHFTISGRNRLFSKIKLFRAISGVLIIALSVILSHLFTNANTVIESEKVNVQFEIYTFVLLSAVVLIVIASIIFLKNVSTKLNKR